MGTVHWIEFKSNVLCKSIDSKTFNLIWIIFLKIVNCRGQRGHRRSQGAIPTKHGSISSHFVLWEAQKYCCSPEVKHFGPQKMFGLATPLSTANNGWARVKRERMKSSERLLRTVCFDSSHLQHERERPDIERKHMISDKAQWKEPELTTLISEAGGGTNVQHKLTHVLHYSVNRIRRLGLSPSAGVATDLNTSRLALDRFVVVFFIVTDHIFREKIRSYAIYLWCFFYCFQCGRFGVLFFIATNLLFGSISAIEVFVKEKDVFVWVSLLLFSRQ